MAILLEHPAVAEKGGDAGIKDEIDNLDAGTLDGKIAHVIAALEVDLEA